MTTLPCSLPSVHSATAARAPLRISFGGGGTDLAAYYERFGGFVVSAAITRYCHVSAYQPEDGGIHLISADYGVSERYHRGEAPAVAGPLALPKAAVEHFWERGLCELGVALALSSQVPPGTGLGSSSAMAAALIRALSAYVGTSMSAAEVADLACRLEIERLGMPIGRQDQYASAFGGVNTIEFTADDTRVTALDLTPPSLTALEDRLLLFSTGQSHNSAHILHQQGADSRRNPVVIESLHTIKRLAGRMCAALAAGELDCFGDLLDQSWRAKRTLSTKISSQAIDRYYAAARAAGALGGKITGAGGGGFLLLYVPPRAQRAVRAAMARAGLQEMPFSFDHSGATTFTMERTDTCAMTLNNTGATSRA